MFWDNFFGINLLLFAHHFCPHAGYLRKYWSVLLVLDLRKTSGLMFASMLGRALSHVNLQNVLQFFLEILYSVFRWEYISVRVNRKYNKWQ